MVLVVTEVDQPIASSTSFPGFRCLLSLWVTWWRSRRRRWASIFGTKTMPGWEDRTTTLTWAERWWLQAGCSFLNRTCSKFEFEFSSPSRFGRACLNLSILFVGRAFWSWSKSEHPWIWICVCHCGTVARHVPHLWQYNQRHPALFAKFLRVSAVNADVDGPSFDWSLQVQA